MTTMKTTSGRNERSEHGTPTQSGAALQTRDDAEFPRRDTQLDWDAMVADYAVIERRAQAMRSEAAWNMFRALRDRVVKAFSHGKAKAGAAATAPLERHGQPV